MLEVIGWTLVVIVVTPVTVAVPILWWQWVMALGDKIADRITRWGSRR